MISSVISEHLNIKTQSYKKVVMLCRLFMSEPRQRVFRRWPCWKWLTHTVISDDLNEQSAQRQFVSGSSRRLRTFFRFVVWLLLESDSRFYDHLRSTFQGFSFFFTSVSVWRSLRHGNVQNCSLRFQIRFIFKPALLCVCLNKDEWHLV